MFDIYSIHPVIQLMCWVRKHAYFQCPQCFGYSACEHPDKTLRYCQHCEGRGYFTFDPSYKYFDAAHIPNGMKILFMMLAFIVVSVISTIVMASAR